MKQSAQLDLTARPVASKQRLRVWLRVLKLQRQMEATLRDRLRISFNTTLPRFDVLAALDHHGDGLRMSELSSFLKVSNGNITAIVDRLAGEGLVVRVPVEGDRRAMLVRLTATGRDQFAKMAHAHEDWVSELLAGLTPQECGQLMALLTKAAKPGGGQS